MAASAQRIDVVTLFPDMLRAVLDESMMRLAQSRGAAAFGLINPRDFTTDRHRSVDARPFGGGPGMVMMPDPLFQAVESVRAPESRVILLGPRGRTLTHAVARDLAGQPHLILICGHYEGVDERVREHLADEEISIGDYVLTSGTLAAAVLIDAVVRLRPGVLGAGEGATESESFAQGMLECPQYTRPADYRGWTVPEVLRSGHHAEIEAWRHEQALRVTRRLRPDLLDP